MRQRNTLKLVLVVIDCKIGLKPADLTLLQFLEANRWDLEGIEWGSRWDRVGIEWASRRIQRDPVWDRMGCATPPCSLL